MPAASGGIAVLKRNLLFFAVSGLLAAGIMINTVTLFSKINFFADAVGEDYIKWVEFDVPYAAMEKALNLDIKTKESGCHIEWVENLAYLATKYGGNWKKYKAKDMDRYVQEVKNGRTAEELCKDTLKYYRYFLEAYDAVLGGMVGEYEIESADTVGTDQPQMVKKYGLKAYSPVAYGYSFSHYDDFGNSRDYGYKRKHLGNDLLGSIGTPIVAVESGTVEAAGWNQYGGWRIGIRSFDKKRYYYYAHLRKGHPFHPTVQEGAVVQAGDVIGYLGMTGYSTKEDVNGMTKPHLHFGMQLIFDESQKEGNNEIWIDVYQIVKLLQKHTSPVVRNEETKDYTRKYRFTDPIVPQNGST